MRLTKAIIHTDNIAFNIRQIKKHTGGAKLCAVVKAGGYGTDSVLTAKVAMAEGIDTFAVATVKEGLELRENGIRGTILLLSPFDKSEIPAINESELTPCISSSQEAEDIAHALSLIEQKKTKLQKVYLAIDTGMGRVGCFEEDASKSAKAIKAQGLDLSGVITHFSVGDSCDEGDIEYTKNSFESFKRAIDSVVGAGFKRQDLCCTASASSTFLMGHCEGVAKDMVRAGIILYGYEPSEDVKKAMDALGLKLRPTMSVVSSVAMVKKIKAGGCVSYGRTFCAKRDTFVAVIPMGYADGLLRRYADFLEVSIGGKKYKVAGRICMDMFMADLGDNSAGVKAGDAVIIFGDKEKGAAMDAADIAKASGTISYEVTSLISKRVPRVAEGDGVSK